MVFKFIQTKKDLYSASFNIVDSDGKQIGDAELSGSITRLHGDWVIHVGEKVIRLVSIHVKDAISACAGLTKDKIMYPYNIEIDGVSVGTVFQGRRKNSLFEEYNIHQIYYKDSTGYHMYPIGFGEYGSKNPIFFYEPGGYTQIAQIKKDAETIDDLHIFHAYVADEKKDKDILTTIIFCALMYTLGCYKPGEKVVKGKKKTISITKNQEVLSKYNPDFWNI